MKKFVLFGCLLWVMQAVGQENWSRVNLGDKVSIEFPKQPNMEVTETGPQAQLINNQNAKFTAMLVDLEKTGVEKGTVQNLNDRQFRNFASSIAMKGNVKVKRVINGMFENRFRSALVKGVNDEGKAVTLQFVLFGNEVAVLGYSAEPSKTDYIDMKKFFTSLDYSSYGGNYTSINK